MKKLILFFSLFIPGVLEAAPIQYIQVATGTLQANTTNGFFVQRGTVTTFSAVVIQSTSGASSISINPSGSVGIASGTFTRINISTLTTTNHIALGTTPATNFDSSYTLLRMGQAGTLLSKNTLPSESAFSHNYYFDGSDKRLVTGAVSVFTQASDGSHRFYSDVSGTAGVTFILTERFRIEQGVSYFSNSRVGIGTAAPSDVLVVSSNTVANVVIVSTASSSSSSIDWRATTSVGTPQRWKAGVGISSANGTFEIRDLTAGANRLQISTQTGAVEIWGTNTNDNASPGFIGQTISSTTLNRANFAATGQYSDLLSISLPPGDWLVSAQVQAADNGATVNTWSLGISQTAGNSSSGLTDENNLALLPPNSNSGAGGSIPSYRQSLASVTTIYLKYRAVFSVATPQAGGRISAVRIR